MSKFETSKTSGVHKRLEAFVGNWKGTCKTWFEPDVLVDESPMEGSLRLTLGGRFLLYEYTGTLQGKSFEGLNILGYDLSTGTFQSAWIDSFHMSTGILFSEGEAGAEVFSVLGSYGGPDIPVPWGWRTTLEMISDNELIVTAFNITPDGQEAKATETIYQRVV